MKWRCTWCGKPHDEDDPPCDACGHNAFERAVVREDEDTAAGRTVDTGTTYVWTCPNCSRAHVKNNPPCSRCGNPELEKTEQNYDGIDQDLATPSWFEVAKPYAPVFVVVAIVALLFATGIVSLSVIPGVGPPSPPDAPGNGSEAAGLDLDATAVAIYDELEAERDAAGDEARTYDDGVAAYAEYQNRYLVAVEFTDDDPERPPHPDEFGHDCGDELPELGPLTVETVTIEDYSSETELASDLADSLLTQFETETRSGYDTEGIDVHVGPDDRVYVMYGVC